MPSSYIALTLGGTTALVLYTLAGRLAGFSAVAVSSAATAYFFMDPVFSFQVSQGRDAMALAVFGAAGVILLKTRHPKQNVEQELEVNCGEPPCDDLVDFAEALHMAARTAKLGKELSPVQVEIQADYLQGFKCSRNDASLILSTVFSRALDDPLLRGISFQVGRKPGSVILFADFRRAWPPPPVRVTIGLHEEQCVALDLNSPQSAVKASCFESQVGRTYQFVIPERARFS